jgi:hypothetical protein
VVAKSRPLIKATLLRFHLLIDAPGAPCTTWISPHQRLLSLVRWTLVDCPAWPWVEHANIFFKTKILTTFIHSCSGPGRSLLETHRILVNGITPLTRAATSDDISSSLSYQEFWVYTLQLKAAQFLHTKKKKRKKWTKGTRRTNFAVRHPLLSYCY